MLENLNQLVKENAQQAIVNNSAVPDEQNEAAVSAASGSIMEALQSQVSSGNLANLVAAFKGGDVQNSTVVQEASSSFVDKLSGMGINLESAKGIAASLIPGIVGQFVNKTNDPNDSSFNIQDIITKISGPDGKFQLSDLTDLFNGSNAEPGSAESQGGGIVDKLKGLFS
ncbi:hypothetical protein [Pedobacter antarcticus]|uniref:hypothetical protein n=1 Tax=Pedobacter antarcticus TaxID=34086 RepID=UPI001C5654DD|nr:hypothetical protein [Pedobacter antarcticus]